MTNDKGANDKGMKKAQSTKALWMDRKMRAERWGWDVSVLIFLSKVCGQDLKEFAKNV